VFEKYEIDDKIINSLIQEYFIRENIDFVGDDEKNDLKLKFQLLYKIID